MTSQRGPQHRRGVWVCTAAAVALVLASGGLSAAPEAKKPAEKHATKPKKDAPKKEVKKKEAPKKDAARKEPSKKDTPAPRTASATLDAKAPAKSGHILSPAAILPTGTFVPAARNAVPTMVPTAAPPPPPILQQPSAPLAVAGGPGASAADIALVKRAIQHARDDEASKAIAIQKQIEDPLARKLVEWVVLRSDDHEANFDRFAAFLSANPSWPGTGMMRRRAEGGLWDEKREPATVRAFFGAGKPTTAKGRFALARALLASGDRASAAHLVREAWRTETFSRDLEKQAEDAFGDLLTRADHRARMDRFFHAAESDAGLRFAQRLGGDVLAIGKAWEAVIDRSSKAGALLDAVPSSARNDAGYLFARAQWLRRQEKWAEAGRVVLAAPRDPALLVNLDEWWTERRLIARGLLDQDDAQTAYHIARDTVRPTKEGSRWESEFTAGWIALRFLNNPTAAYQHFQRVDDGTVHPTTVARAEYWQGRAAEALGRQVEARAHYQQAAHYPTAYYGQIARAKLGLGDFTLRRPPESGNRAALASLEVVRAAQILYAVDARDLVLPFATDLAERAVDSGALVVIAELAKHNEDARTMLYLGKAAIARGLAFDIYAFPTNGIPNYRLVGPEVDRSVVYSIARQESAFNPRAVSPAKALGLMQVMAGTAKMVTKKYGMPFDAKRLLSDPVYNAQIGTAELGDRLQDYRGSYILTFCAYNAGPGRARQWINRYGDPRDADVDPIDWVERIPIAETRNYVQRILENMQVYRAQLGKGSRLLIEADLRAGRIN